MGKYDIVFSCGHTETVELFGKSTDRDSKIAYYGRCCVCSACKAAERAAKLAENHDLIEMRYGEYKTKYSSCPTVSGSYDPVKKTIKVWIPKPVDLAAKAEAITANISASAQIVDQLYPGSNGADALQMILDEIGKPETETADVFALFGFAADKVPDPKEVSRAVFIGKDCDLKTRLQAAAKAAYLASKK